MYGWLDNVIDPNNPNPIVPVIDDAKRKLGTAGLIGLAFLVGVIFTHYRFGWKK